MTDRKQLALEIHSPIRHKFPRRRVIVSHIDHVWASDLVEMPPERGFKFILTVVDVFSKFGWAVPLKTKSGIEMTEAFEKIFDGHWPPGGLGRIPKKIWSDKGK